MSLVPPKGVYRLSLNENLFIPRDLIKEVVEKASKSIDPRLYAEAYGEELAENLSVFHGVDTEEVVVGAGADYLIYLTAHLGREKGLTIVEPTFEEYERAAKLLGASYRKVLLSEDFQLVPERVIERDASLTYMASPNNPTGNQFTRESVEEVVESFRGIVVVDEAYAEYARYTLLGEAPSRDNLIVVRTFSKAWGLAGLRVGYAVTNRGLADLLRERGMVFACSSLSLKTAVMMLDRWSEVLKAVEEAKNVREWMRAKLSELPVKVYPSDANFLLVRLPFSSKLARELLLEKGFAVKDVGHMPLCTDCIRVTVPPRDIAEAFIETLSEIASNYHLGEAA